MDQIHRIRNLRKFEGKSLRKIAEITGCDFATVKKYLEKDNFNLEIRPKQQRAGKLSPYKDIVIKWLQDDLNAPHKQRHTAKRVYDRLKELYPGFDASDRSVRDFVAKLKTELKIDNEGSLPLEHPPGEAQVDFGEARFIENGATYDGYYLNISYPHSNAGYTQLFKSQNQECLLEGLKAIFEHVGGVPTAIWFDNMSTAVKKIKEHGERDLTKGFLRFMMHYGFRSNFCNPNAGNEKGSVESKVGYHRRNLFVPIPDFKDLREYNKELLHRLDQDMKRQHYRGFGLIKELFEEDKKEFFKLPEASFDVYLHEFVKADNYGKIKFQTKVYSTSPSMAGKQVMIKAGAYDLEILDNNAVMIVKHKRLYGAENESMIWIPYLELMAKRPTALKYTGLFNQLPTTLKAFLDSCDYECKRQTLKIFVRMTLDSNMDSAVEAFEEGIKCGVWDADSIWATYCRLTSGNQPQVDISLPSTVPKLNEYSLDISSYDDLITSGGLVS
ncbi:transposase [Alkaliphilus hydrothermalis]|uniref:Transposase n=2 Tax=Alkaliphilus hydrothermalis TaxID=1482730 RepID=A0ABS2NU19_9FIRM|nr:transposase [Alkaliphilus hydrothermalis]